MEHCWQGILVGNAGKELQSALQGNVKGIAGNNAQFHEVRGVAIGKQEILSMFLKKSDECFQLLLFIELDKLGSNIQAISFWLCPQSVETASSKFVVGMVRLG